MSILFIFFMILFGTSDLKMPDPNSSMVIWNVGQGQWISHVSADECQHFDVGGEFQAFKNIFYNLSKNCSAKLNRIYVSHWDWDHTLHIPKFIQKFKRVCFAHAPIFGQQKKFVKKLSKFGVEKCRIPNSTKPNIWSPKNYSQTNESSSVFTLNRILISGDSPSKQEKEWQREININNHDIFVLGHHGSKTSNSESLLNAWPALLMAVASARQQVYNHPHPDIRQRLRSRQIPLLTTEKWGNIRIAF